MAGFYFLFYIILILFIMYVRTVALVALFSKTPVNWRKSRYCYFLINKLMNNGGGVEGDQQVNIFGISNF